MNTYDMVVEFHRATGATIGRPNTFPTASEAALRYELIREELAELEASLRAGDYIGVADALADLDYVVNGAAIAFGIHLPTVTSEVHESNMTKLGIDGKPLLREDGKVLKGPNYRRPDIVRALDYSQKRLENT